MVRNWNRLKALFARLKQLLTNLLKRPKPILCYDCYYYSTARGDRCAFDGSSNPKKTECENFEEEV